MSSRPSSLVSVNGSLAEPMTWICTQTRPFLPRSAASAPPARVGGSNWTISPVTGFHTRWEGRRSWISRWATDLAETPWGSAGQMNQTVLGAPPSIDPESPGREVGLRRAAMLGPQCPLKSSVASFFPFQTFIDTSGRVIVTARCGSPHGEGEGAGSPAGDGPVVAPSP